MAEILIHPTQDVWDAQRRAERRGNRLEVRGDRLVEVVPQAKRRGSKPSDGGPKPVA